MIGPPSDLCRREATSILTLSLLTFLASDALVSVRRKTGGFCRRVVVVRRFCRCGVVCIPLVAARAGPSARFVHFVLARSAFNRLVFAWDWVALQSALSRASSSLPNRQPPIASKPQQTSPPKKEWYKEKFVIEGGLKVAEEAVKAIDRNKGVQKPAVKSASAVFTTNKNTLRRTGIVILAIGAGAATFGKKVGRTNGLTPKDDAGKS